MEVTSFFMTEACLSMPAGYLAMEIYTRTKDSGKVKM